MQDRIRELEMLALQGSLCSKDSNEGGVVLDNTNSTTTEVLRLKDALRRLQALYEAEKLVTANQRRAWMTWIVERKIKQSRF